MALVKFNYCIQSVYDTLQTPRDLDSLYFVTDTRRIYKGDLLLSSDTAEFVTEIPEFEQAQSNKLYISTNGTAASIYVKGTDTMVEVAGGTLKPGAITNINIFNPDMVTLSSELESGNLPQNDTTLPTSGAVRTAIETAIESIDLSAYDEAFTNVSASANTVEGETGTILTFTRKSGTNPVEVKIADLFLSNAVYDPETHNLTLTVGTGKSVKTVVVNLDDLVPQSVDASQVAMAREITVTTDVGNLKAGDKVIITGDPESGEVKAADVQAMFEAILSKDINPVATQPSASVTLSGAGEKEVGTEFTPSFTATLNPGKYTVQGQKDQPSEVIATTYTITDTRSNSADTSSGSFSAFTIDDDTDYYVSATVSYGDGAIPKTFLGKDYPKAQIKAGSKSATSAHVKGFRNCWCGVKTPDNIIADPAKITVEEIKSLGNSNKNKPTSIKATDMQQMFFAVPATMPNTSSLSIVGTESPLPQTVHGPIDISIGGVNNYSPIAYKVFYVSNAAPATGTDTYKLTWS